MNSCDKYRVMDDQQTHQAHKDYLANQVFSAHPAERVYLLYQVAIDSVNAAIARLKDGDIFARGRAVNKAHEAVDELILALDHSVGANFTHTLAELYDYVQRQLVKGHSQKSEEAFRQALSVLTTLTDAWKQVVETTCGSGLFNSELLADNPLGIPEEGPVAKTAEVSEPHAAYGEAPQTPSISRDWCG
jgi:flagellar biosynthetic protein FliS